MSLSDVPTTKPKKQSRGWIHEVISTIVYPLVTVLAIYSLLIQPFRIPSGSMIDTLLIGDFVWVEKFAYGYSKHSIPFSPPLFSGRIWSAPPTQGDVVVFKLPSDNSTDYIKRLVGMPGDRVQMKKGLLYINGVELKRDFVENVDLNYYDPQIGTTVNLRGKRYRETLPNGLVHVIIKTTDIGGGNDTNEFTVPPDHYFMMGDDRDNSSDSRFAPVGTPGDFLVSQGGVGFVPFENLVGKAIFIFPSFDGGKSEWWQVWNWPFAIRWDRLFHGID